MKKLIFNIILLGSTVSLHAAGFTVTTVIQPNRTKVSVPARYIENPCQHTVRRSANGTCFQCQQKIIQMTPILLKNGRLGKSKRSLKTETIAQKVEQLIKLRG